MDSSEDIVLEHCQHLLVNSLYSLVGRHLELYHVENCDGEYKQQVVSLIMSSLSIAVCGRMNSGENRTAKCCTPFLTCPKHG